MTARLYTAAEAEDFLNDPSPSSEYDMTGVAEDLARSVVHWAVRADVAEAENDRLRGLMEDAYGEGYGAAQRGLCAAWTRTATFAEVYEGNPADDLYAAVRLERARQDRKWGFPSTSDPWMGHLATAVRDVRELTGPDLRDGLVRVAALALAYAESIHPGRVG